MGLSFGAPRSLHATLSSLVFKSDGAFRAPGIAVTPSPDGAHLRAVARICGERSGGARGVSFRGFLRALRLVFRAMGVVDGAFSRFLGCFIRFQ